MSYFPKKNDKVSLSPRKYYAPGSVPTDPLHDGYFAPYPYTYTYDVPSIRHMRSLYGRGAMSEYGYRSPYAYRADAFRSEAYRPEVYRTEAYRPDAYRSEAYRTDTYRPESYRTELFGGRYQPYLSEDELEYYYLHHPRFSRYYRHW
ncbi:uncharacterized protein LOC128215562 [Mya arenaria]|uniref:uncharacterized protein LOC128215562 n=1 Tax=Mya arenaria TaxID=6604 RepID=UPI0022E475B6|nr:uncharacterized protein LOC128215562 [Mya arenaria]